MPMNGKFSLEELSGRLVDTNELIKATETYKEKEEKEKQKKERRESNFKKWIWFYRNNPHRAIKDYFGVNLKLFQAIVIYILHHYQVFMWIASRSSGKSFLIAVYALYRGVFYPGSKIIISAKTRQQATLMIKQYCADIIKKSENLQLEVEEVSTGTADPKVTFYNGSTINAVTPSDNSRGYRANVLILEEFVHIPKDIVDAVLKKFKTTPRQPKFLENPEYQHMIEKNKEIYISSAYFKHNWGWDKYREFINGMVKRDNDYYFVLNTNYRLPLLFGLGDEDDINEQLESKGLDELTWSMEMESLFFGENKNSLFTFAMFDKNRRVDKAWYPFDHAEFHGKKTPKKPQKRMGEVRVLSVDVAISSKKDSDNTVLCAFSAVERSDHYERQLKYIEHHNGMKIPEQALAIKRLWYDFDIDYLAFDIHVVGLALYDELTKETYDPDRDIEYPAFVCYNDETYFERAYDKNGVKNIFSINASSIINDAMIRNLRVSLTNGKLKLLQSENDFRDMMMKQDESWINASQDKKIFDELPYVQTTILINESINLNGEIVNGKLKVKETGRNRKDRFSSLAMGDYLITQLEHEMLQNRRSPEDDDSVFVLGY